MSAKFAALNIIWTKYERKCLCFRRFCRVLQPLAALKRLSGVKRRIGRGSDAIRALRKWSAIDAFFTYRPCGRLWQCRFHPENRPKRKKGRRREPQAFLGRSSRVRRKERRGV
ncbi:hypothetical protein C9418_05400 [Rhizobium sp. SEMIA 4032]|nr:hypothetical protein C9418_05400 [Rhizobium sp. SEMIA 4032]